MRWSESFHFIFAARMRALFFSRKWQIWSSVAGNSYVFTHYTALHYKVAMSISDNLCVVWVIGFSVRLWCIYTCIFSRWQWSDHPRQILMAGLNSDQQAEGRASLFALTTSCSPSFSLSAVFLPPPCGLVSPLTPVFCLSLHRSFSPPLSALSALLFVSLWVMLLRWHRICCAKHWLDLLLWFCHFPPSLHSYPPLSLWAVFLPSFRPLHPSLPFSPGFMPIFSSLHSSLLLYLPHFHRPWLFSTPLSLSLTLNLPLSPLDLLSTCFLFFPPTLLTLSLSSSLFQCFLSLIPKPWALLYCIAPEKTMFFQKITFTKYYTWRLNKCLFTTSYQFSEPSLV